MKFKKATKIAGRVGRTGLDVAKLALSAETGNLKGGNSAVLDIARTWGGKNNVLQRSEDRLDKSMSKYVGYRVAKGGYNLYNDAKGGNYTGVYRDSMDLAKNVLGKKRYGRTGLDHLDAGVQKYVMPAAQHAQDSYQLYKNITTLPKSVKKLSSPQGGARDALRVGMKVNTIQSKARKVYG